MAWGGRSPTALFILLIRCSSQNSLQPSHASLLPSCGKVGPGTRGHWEGPWVAAPLSFPCPAPVVSSSVKLVWLCIPSMFMRWSPGFTVSYILRQGNLRQLLSLPPLPGASLSCLPSLPAAWEEERKLLAPAFFAVCHKPPCVIPQRSSLRAAQLQTESKPETCEPGRPGTLPSPSLHCRSHQLSRLCYTVFSQAPS